MGAVVTKYHQLKRKIKEADGKIKEIDGKLDIVLNNLKVLNQNGQILYLNKTAFSERKCIVFGNVDNEMNNGTIICSDQVYAADSRENETVSSQDNLLKETNVKENESINESNTSEHIEIKSSTSDSDTNVLSNQTNESTQENDSIDSGTVNGNTFPDGEQNKTKHHSDSKTKILSQQSNELTKENNFIEGGLYQIDKSNVSSGGQNEIKCTTSDSNSQILSIEQSSQLETETSINKSKSSDAGSAHSEIYSNKEHTGSAHNEIYSNKEHTGSAHNEIYSNKEHSEYKALSNETEIRVKNLSEEPGDLTKLIGPNDYIAIYKIKAKKFHKQTDGFTLQNEEKAIEKDIALMKHNFSSVLNNPVLSPERGLSTDILKYGRNRILLESDILINSEFCKNIARIIEFPVSFEDSRTVGVFFVRCQCKSDIQIRNIQALQVRIYNNVSDLGTYISFPEIESSDSSSICSKRNKYRMFKGQLETEIYENKMRYTRSLVDIKNGSHVFTISGLDFISDRYNRFEIHRQMEAFYCTQIADRLDFNLSNNATLYGLLNCCQTVTNSYNNCLHDWLESYECQVKLLANPNNILFGQRARGDTTYIQDLGDENLIPVKHNGIIHRTNHKFACHVKRNKRRSKNFEIDIGSDEYESSPCQELMLYKSKEIRLNNDELTRHSRQYHAMWNLLFEMYRLYIFTCFLIAIYAEEFDTLKMSHKARTLFTQMNVVRAEYFECAMRESARIQVQLTFTHIYTLDNRIPTAVPIYVDGFIHRKDGRR